MNRSKARHQRALPGKARLAEMIEDATVDAHDESEQTAGWFNMLDEHLELPFETEVLGTTVTVVSLDHRHNDQLVAMCARGKLRQPISLLDLPAPTPPPPGWEWVEAYRQWIRGVS